ncbi:MAG: hypothetical protein GF421_06640 [Candidatus Aminicenantes bacterium]|nr:hypothetical protein [Candidatus Aminicenantes bacterium]
MYHTKIRLRLKTILVCSLPLLIFLGNSPIQGQSLDIPTKKWGISFGNSKEFTGLRFNIQDHGVQQINGINFTLWKPKEGNPDSVINGVSLGLMPGGGHLRGIQLGLAGAGAETSLKGISIGLLGVGAGGDVVGINISGIGAGAGGNMFGLNFGGLGVGAGEDLIGFNIGGLGCGAGRDMKGFNFGALGAGAGRDVYGLNIGGLGIGAGENMIGINMGGLGVGAGEKLTGINIGGLGCGAPEVTGISIGGLGVGGKYLKGIHLSAGTIITDKSGGVMTGLAVSSFNYIRGDQVGLSIGIVNYAWNVKGVQIGLVNIVRNNPQGLKVLPLFNTSF